MKTVYWCENYSQKQVSSIFLILIYWKNSKKAKNTDRQINWYELNEGIDAIRWNLRFMLHVKANENKTFNYFGSP